MSHDIGDVSWSPAIRLLLATKAEPGKSWPRSGRTAWSQPATTALPRPQAPEGV